MLKSKLLLFIGLLIFLLSLDQFSYSASQMIGVKGSVEKKNGRGSWKQVNKGDRLSSKDWIKTGKASIAVIKLDNGVRLKIGSNSVIHLSKIGNKRQQVSIKKGVLLANVNKLKRDERFGVSSPNSLAGVRGTLFWGKVEGEGKDQKSAFCVKEGKVEVRSSVTNESVIVDEGLGTEVVSNKSPEKPKPVQGLIDSINWDMNENSPIWKNK